MAVKLLFRAVEKPNAHVYESTQQQSPEVEHPYDHVQQRAQNEDYEITAPFAAWKKDDYVDVKQGEKVQAEAGRGEWDQGHQVYEGPRPYKPQEPHSYDVLRPKT